MGMFDELECQYPLPLPENQGELAGRDWQDDRFQTKDFECLMEQYCIRDDGTLWRQTCTWQTTPKGRPHRKPAGWEALRSYTGTVHFYHGINGGRDDYWVEWRATFVTGRILELELQRWEARDNSERLACDSKWKLENERRDLFLKTWIGRRVYPSYAWIVHGFVGMQVSPIHRFCDCVARQRIRARLWLDRLAARLAPYGDPIRQQRRFKKWKELFEDDD